MISLHGGSLETSLKYPDIFYILQVPREQCNQVPRQECRQVPKSYTTTESVEECSTVTRPVCRPVPRNQCKDEQQQVSTLVPKQKCYFKPKQVKKLIFYKTFILLIETTGELF